MSLVSIGIAATDKCQKHGVSVREVESAFARSIAVIPDPAHSGNEERFMAIGTTAEGRIVFVVFTLRDRHGATLIRPVSARYMHRREVDYYEKAVPKV